MQAGSVIIAGQPEKLAGDPCEAVGCGAGQTTAFPGG